VASCDKPAPIAYLLLRLVIGPNGELMPKLNTRIKESAKVGHLATLRLTATAQPRGGVGVVT